MGEMSEAWPGFNLVFIELDSAVPVRTRQMLGELEIVDDILNGMFKPLPRAKMSDWPSGEGLLLIGTASEGTEQLCIDPETGVVVTIYSDKPGALWWHTNRSLRQFNECARIAEDRFPYYSQVEVAEADDVCDSVADDLVIAMESVDSTAFMTNGFWSVFIDDIRIGDFATEVILGVGIGG
ncbi:SUKH-4 family immunity protein [Stackebrandtia albiflava]|uniref:SUKH-4 family immunity protein n=1 Tax=Stackebrandtia albiflava TaxID=406432 RepID=UPI0013150AE1|nr:SUKH-4 family immunity protein [Stackebrandtia albiflava]